jgi:hypothetical protein
MPVVFMNHDTGFMGEVVRFMHVPASVALAYDRRGRAEGGRHGHTCADCGSGKVFSEHLHFSPLLFAPRTNTFGGSAFRDETTILRGLEREAARLALSVNTSRLNLMLIGPA